MLIKKNQKLFQGVYNGGKKQKMAKFTNFWQLSAEKKFFFQTNHNKTIFPVKACIVMSISLANNLHRNLNSVFLGLKNPKNSLIFTKCLSIHSI